MITLVLVTFLGVLLVIVLMRLANQPEAQRPKASPPPAPAPDLANLKVTDARVGDVLSISGAGDDLSDLDFTADRCAWFEAGPRRWFELTGDYRERRVALRVATGDDLEVAVETGPRKLTVEDLGVSEDDLAQMDERQNTADNFEFDGKVWLYRLSREAQARRNDQPEPANFYYWEFQEQGGKGLLAIRKAEGEPFAVTLATAIFPGDVTVYRGGRA
ncbi:MAG: hypothetical protein ABSH44_02570 [Bryobacteraceae bacterium]|jgi:hypothetical protein